MSRSLFATLIGAAFLVVAGTAVAQQWMPGDDHKMHFPQYPNEYGWNVYDGLEVIHLADDWECIEPGTVNDIHFWGSWKGGDAGVIEGFTITIYDDIPADQNPLDYSMPGAVLWGPVYIAAADVEEYHIVPDPEAWEGWYDPLTGAMLWPDHNNFYQYDINDIAGTIGIDPFVQTEGAIYWLEIAATVEVSAAPKYWGWKSSYRHFNDDAVRTGDAGGTPWIELLEPDLGAAYNSFHVVLDDVGQIVEGNGEFAWNDRWYFYDDDGEWWNIWFYDHPLNYDRWKEVNVTGSFVALDPGIPGDIIIAVNWSTPAWSWVGNPPGEPRRPPMNEDIDPMLPVTYLERFVIYQGPVSGIPVDIGSLGYNINDYNPEWVSIDVRGTNFVFDGAITHQCIGEQPVSMDLAFVISGEPLPDAAGACCWPDGNCTIETQTDCEAVNGIEGTYMGDGTVCAGDGDGNGIDDLCDNVTPMGACCASDGGCYRTYQAVCEGNGDTYVGHGTACVGDLNGNGFDETCDAPPGACCLPGGSCVLTDAGSCLGQNGDYQGDGTVCLGDGNLNGIDDACEDADELKWFQPPDLDVDGMDVSAYNIEGLDSYVLATDFECTSTGPITEIHIFGSWYLDKLPFDDPSNVHFNLSMHEDITAAQSGVGYSLPGAQVCFLEDVPFDVKVYASDLQEGWFEPPNNYTMYPLGDRVCWEYTFHIDGNCTQSGTESSPIVYWIDLQAYPDDPTAFFGWKTTREEWNDWAVWADGDDQPGSNPSWNELRLASTGWLYTPGDIDDDGDVDMDDVYWLADHMTLTGPPPVYSIPGTNPPFYAAADVNGNCVPGELADLQQLGAWVMTSMFPPSYCSSYPPGLVPGRAMDLALAIYGPSASMDQGSCCYDNGTCTDDMTEADCVQDGGSWAGVGTTCGGDGDGNGVDDACEATVPMGACCWGNPIATSCVNTTQYLCELAGGGYAGTWYAGQDCGDVDFTCPVAGACCYEDAAAGWTCIITDTQADCEALSNATWYEGVDCASIYCTPSPTGACCYDNGSCVDGMTQADCVASGGDYGGDGTNCANADSDQNGIDDFCDDIVTMGACCWGNPIAPSCVNTTQYLCELAGGGYAGTWYAGQDCDTFTCPEGDDLKWIQPPDLNPTGMDILDMHPMILADDFECTSTGPITQVDVWGSWWMDEYPNAGPGDIAFTLSIHEDIPATSTVIYPADCPYLTTTGSWDIIEGLPPGTEINSVGTLSNFDVTQREPGGEFGGEIVNFDATLELQMVGVGQLAGFSRTVLLEVSCEVHTSCVPPEPCGTVETELLAMELTGELPPGDPDFDLLEVAVGSAQGLTPTLGSIIGTEQPGGGFSVNSFFDVYVEITFTGSTGGAVEGLSGATLSNPRIEQADPSGGPCEVPGEGEHSMPAEAICVYHFGPGEFEVIPEVDPGTITEGWFDPQSGEYLFPGDHNCWKYTFDLPGDCIQEGLPNAPRVYWLDVQAHYLSGPESVYFGWKTSLSHWNDDAVWATGDDPVALLSPWLEMWYPVQHQLYGQSVALAFAIHGEIGTDTCLGQMPGDYNSDGDIDNTDLNDLIAYVNDPDPAYEANPKANGDFNGDCRVNSWDVQDMTNFLATGGPAPADCTCLNPYGPCCIGIVGNANLDPDEKVTIGDISVMIDAKFITGTCVGILECLTEADVNLTGRATPDCGDITIGDISTLIDHLFISGPTVLFLKDCY